MKTSIFKTGSMLAACLLISLTTLAKEVTKEYHKTFPASSSSKVFIENKFGAVKVQSGNQNEVVFDVIVSVEADNDDQAKKLLDQIHVTLKSSGDKISGITEMDNKLTSNQKGKKTKFTIDYTITVPIGIEMNIEHSFGDVSINELTGTTDIEISFGSLNANSLTGKKNSLTMSYSDFTIGTLANADLELSFTGESKIKKAGALSVESSYSKLSIGSVRSLSLEASFSEIKIAALPMDFEEVEIEASMSTIDLGIDPASGFSLIAELSMGDLNIPDGMKNIVKKKDLMNTRLSGTYGNGKSNITIECSMGSVDIHFSK